MRIFPYAAINFSTFDYLRENVYYRIDKENKILKNLVLFLSGCTSATIALISCYPFDMVRVRMAMEKNNFSYNSIS